MFFSAMWKTPEELRFFGKTSRDRGFRSRFVSERRGTRPRGGLPQLAPWVAFEERPHSKTPSGGLQADGRRGCRRLEKDLCCIVENGGVASPGRSSRPTRNPCVLPWKRSRKMVVKSAFRNLPKPVPKRPQNAKIMEVMSVRGSEARGSVYGGAHSCGNPAPIEGRRPAP